jgi:hypothetical protein
VTVNVELLPVTPSDTCDVNGATSLIVNVVRGTPATGLLTSVSTVLGRTITSAAGPPDTRATVSPTQLTFNSCGVTQALTITGGSVADKATTMTFDSTGTGSAVSCTTSMTCALAGRFVVVTRARSRQSLPAVVHTGTSWSLRDSLTTGPATTTFTLGSPPLAPLMGDWNGDGTKTPGTFEAGTFKLSNTIPPGPTPDLTFTFGDPRGFPVAGDFDGDGKDDVAVYRAGQWQVRLTATAATSSFSFGSGSWPATVPVAGDWDNNGTDGIGTYTLMGPGTIGQWNLRNTASAGAADAGSFTYGGSGLYPVVGDWNADGTDTVGVKVMAGTTWSLNNANDSSGADVTIEFGVANDLPLVWVKA